jgi:hypothetical protein
VEKVEFLGHPNCYKLSNGTVEVVVTTDIGPRIVRYGFLGEDNILGEHPEAVTKTELGDWKPWAGHRLWAAPEVMPRTYAPDNHPIAFQFEGDLGIRLMQPADVTGIQKEITVSLSPVGTGVTIHHKLTNRNYWGIDTAPWGISVMNGGGVTILPQEPFIAHDDYLLPARPFVLWYFTNLTDPRYTLGQKYICLRTDDALAEPQKIGVANKQGWCGYHRKGTLFVKRFDYQEGARYPDYGSNNETYAAGPYMEIETLAPFKHLDPGESAEHVERWSLFRNVDIGTTETSMEAALTPLVAQTQ